MGRYAFPLAALVLFVAGELEVILEPASGAERAVSVVAMAAITLPLAAAPRAPLPVLAAIAVALAAQAALGGLLVGDTLTTLAVLALALYATGGRLERPWELAAAGVLAVAVVVTRIAVDPAAQRPRDAALTLFAVATPLLIGRWTRQQSLLRRDLSERVARRNRDRERDARQAAEHERERIAADLEVAVTQGLRSIARQTELARDQLAGPDPAGGRATLVEIAATARAALADVRRALGVLRHGEDQAPRTPPGPRRSRVPERGPLPAPPGPAPALAPTRPALLPDALLALAVMTLGGLEVGLAAPSGQQGLAPLTMVAVALPLVWRRRHPLPVSLAVIAAIAVQSLLLDLGSFPTGDIAAMVFASYALGAHSERFAARAGLAALLVAVTAHAAIFYSDGVVPAVLGGAALPWLVGRIVRSNSKLAAAGRRRVAEVEARRERDAQAAVVSERVRVARELHDAVAHSISVIAIQAGSAEGIAERESERALEVAELIGNVAQEAVAELDRLGGSERDAPGLGQIEHLAGRAELTGLEVDVRQEGRPAPLPAGVDLAAYRIVQEALANTAKHAQAEQAWVTVRYAAHAVELEIGDDGAGGRNGRSEGRGGGHGLIGMRERVALYRGSLDAGPRPDGGYLVRARIPVEA